MGVHRHQWSMTTRLICWAMILFVGPQKVPILDFVWPSSRVSKPGWFSHLQTYAPTFPTNRSAHCAFLKQTAEGRQQWIVSLGSNEIRSRAVRSTSEHTIHSVTVITTYPVESQVPWGLFLLPSCPWPQTQSLLSRSKTLQFKHVNND